MMNQQALDALYSATYLEDYLDCMENLPDEIQRNISRMRALDIDYQSYMDDLENAMDDLFKYLEHRNYDSDDCRRAKLKVQKVLIKAQDLGDEKLQLAQNVQDNIENRARQLELDRKNLEYGREMESQETVVAKEDHRPNIKRARRAKHEVYVPSIMGPTTLAVTSYLDSSQEAGPSSNGGRTAAYSAAKAEKPSSGAVASSCQADSSRANSLGNSDEGKSGRGSERGGGGGAKAKQDYKVAKQEHESDATTTHRQERQSHVTPKKQGRGQAQEKKVVKKRKAKQARNQESSPPDPIDPDEPTYCLCDQISYGEMIGCDNDLCPIEWFHFSCVNLSHKPKGKWYCPKCRGDKPNVMKSKALFLKELEKYNREKEEKA